jgi:hypothetical protein
MRWGRKNPKSASGISRRHHRTSCRGAERRTLGHGRSLQSAHDGTDAPAHSPTICARFLGVFSDQKPGATPRIPTNPLLLAVTLAGSRVLCQIWPPWGRWTRPASRATISRRRIAFTAASA